MGIDRSLVPVEGTAKEFKFRGILPGVVQGKNVKASGGSGVNLAQVDSGESAQRAALILIDRRFGAGDFAAGTCLNLEKAERAAIPGDKVDVASAQCGTKAACHHDVALAAEMKERILFATLASFKVGSDVRRLQPRGKPVGGMQYAFKETKMGLSYQGH